MMLRAASLFIYFIPEENSCEGDEEKPHLYLISTA
jgi:hypothetical protein